MDAARIENRVTPWMYGSCIEDVNHEIYGGLYAQCIFGESFEEPPRENGRTPGVSGMWDGFSTGAAQGRFDWTDNRPYNSAHCQGISLLTGNGSVGIANRGLNRWGIGVRAGHEYRGHLYLRAATGKTAPDLTVALQSADGAREYARCRLAAPVGDGWVRRDFALRAAATDPRAMFTIRIDKPGSVYLDQIVLTGANGELFHGLPFRRDIGQALVREKLIFMRYGGSMVNAPEYRWKKMIGPRDKRPEYHGTWYPYSTNGFGIEEFLQFCEAAKIEPAFAINIEETPEDAADLVEYLRGSASTHWGAMRAANGHPRPYNVRYIEIGNEEAIDGKREEYAHYLERFKLLELAMHRRDPSIKLVIAAWWRPNEPLVKRIVQECGTTAALWDVHVGGDGMRDGRDVDRTFTEMQRLFREWSPAATLRAAVFEENGGRHDLQRALGHAGILNATQRHGDFVLMDCPANCLQPLGQNDNGWDQGQVFFTPDHVRGMPPYYAQQMAAANHEPLRVASAVTSPGEDLDVTATRSEDGGTIVLKVVNVGATEHHAAIALSGALDLSRRAETWTLTGDLRAVNTPDRPTAVVPAIETFEGVRRTFVYRFLAHSYTILRLHAATSAIGGEMRPGWTY